MSAISQLWGRSPSIEAMEHGAKQDQVIGKDVRMVGQTAKSFRGVGTSLCLPERMT